MSKSSMYKIGERIGGQYEVYRILGGEKKSGMGVIYVSLDHRSNTIVALKTFQDKFISSEKMKNQFKREALAWIKLEQHPYIVRANGVEKLDHRLFIILEFITPDKMGRNTLTHYFQTTISMRKALEWSIQFCHGMEHATSNGITSHRDIKPDNIMITADGTLKITDFGLAKLWDDMESTADWKDYIKEDLTGLSFLRISKGGVAAGTPPWMAPEQFDGIADIRSDIYSFGVVLYQIANRSKLPFLERTIEEYCWAHKEKPVPKFNSKLFPIIMKCLQKNPWDRYSDFKELRIDLENLYKDKTGVLPPILPGRVELEEWEYYNKGFSFGSLGLLEEAIKEYKKALRINPHYARAHYNLGNVFQRKGLLDEAIKEYREVLRINPNNADAHINLGNVFQRKGLLDEAFKVYREALCINPNLVEIHINWGAALAGKGQLDDAIKEFKEALQINPNLFEGHYSLGITFYDKGQFDDAIKEFKEALRINPDFIEVYNYLGTTFQQKGLLDEAIKVYREALCINPNYAMTHYNLGNALFNKGLLDEAILEYKEALRVNPNHALAYNNLGLAFQRKGILDDAIEAFQNFIKVAPPEYISYIERAKRDIREMEKKK